MKLYLDGKLEIDGPGARFRLATSGSTLTLTADDFRSLLALLRSGPALGFTQPGLRRLNGALAASGITLELRKGRQLLARIGRNGHPILAAISLAIAERLAR